MQGDGIHSFGHGPVCVYCGWDPDTEPERRCDERNEKKPSAEECAEYDRLNDLGEAIQGIGFEVGFGFQEPEAAVEAIRKLVEEYRAASPRSSSER